MHVCLQYLSLGKMGRACAEFINPIMTAQTRESSVPHIVCKNKEQQQGRREKHQK